MKSIVIIGGTGFIGSSLAQTLAAAGHGVTSIARSTDNALPLANNLTQVDCPYDNVEQLGDVYRDADAIFLLAWDTTPATSARSPSLEVTANLLPMMRLLEFLQDNSRAQLVFVSSGGTIYGSDLERPAVEMQAPCPISYYGAGKAAAEQFLAAFSRQTSRRVVVLRPSNVYGPGQLAKRQFGIIPTLLASIRDQRPFKLLGDGTVARDFVYIDDLISACQLLLGYSPASSDSTLTLNIAAGETTTILKLVRMAEEVTGRLVELDHQPSRSVDVGKVSLSNNLAHQLLGWAPRVKLRDGLEHTWHWMQRRAN